MKKTLIVFVILMCNFVTVQSFAQKKAIEQTELKTASPIFSYIYEGDNGDGAVELQIHDRKFQFVGMAYDRMADQAKGSDPKNPYIKLILMPEVDPLAFRQVESLEEAKKEVDGVTVIIIRLNSLREAAKRSYF